MRQVALDTETTGLAPSEGHRVIEISCLEIIDRALTGRYFHTYLQPERPIDPAAAAVNGISDAMLVGQPRFAEIASTLLDFVQGAELIIHNAAFDLGFLNQELSQLTPPRGPLESYCSIFDTLTLARTRHPGKDNSLEELCKRYRVCLLNPQQPAALRDADALARIYLAMTES
jgi:DNA polymerase III subunit epsilon